MCVKLFMAGIESATQASQLPCRLIGSIFLADAGITGHQNVFRNIVSASNSFCLVLARQPVFNVLASFVTPLVSCNNV